MLQVGDNQFIIFQAGDKGPFWMMEEEQNLKWEDTVEEGEMAIQKLMKLELMEKLLEKGVTMKGKLVNLQKAVVDQGIPIEEQSVKVNEGMEGKQKGFLQVL